MANMQIPPEARLNPRFSEDVLPLLRSESKKLEKGVISSILEENQRFYEDINFADLVSRLSAIVDDMRKHVVNRGETTRQALRAMITGEHQFIFAATGVAKSLFASQLFSYIRGSSVFSIQFSPDTTPDDLFGGYDLQRFKRGEIFHNTEGSILTHNFAFLDEFMDANDKILRTLLGVLLERRFINGSQEEPALLHTAIGTSNYVRRSETTMALLDRFLFKSYISPSKDMFSLLKIGQVYSENAGQVIYPPNDMQIDVRELVYLKNLVHNQVTDKSLEIPPEIEYLKNLVAVTFETEMKKYREKYYLSPRTITKSNDLLKTNALLRGDHIANIEDVRSLYFLFSVLHEPLDKDKEIISEQLFSQVAEKRIRYFNSIKEDITPMLYLMDYLHQAERNPELLKQPLNFLQKSARRSLLKDLLERIRKAFEGKETSGVEGNLKNILGYLDTFKSHYTEINDFRTNTENYAKRVFRGLK